MGTFERMMAEIATSLGMAISYCVPDEGGRSAVFERDFEMVERADQVMAFFQPGREMTGGTGHVVEAALMRNKPTEAWTVGDRGELSRVGDWP